jgi:hypothetical protein
VCPLDFSSKNVQEKSLFLVFSSKREPCARERVVWTDVRTGVAIAVGRLPFALPRQRPHHLLSRPQPQHSTRTKRESALEATNNKKEREIGNRVTVLLGTYGCARGPRGRRRRRVRWSDLAGERGQRADVEGDEPAAGRRVGVGAACQVRLPGISWCNSLDARKRERERGEIRNCCQYSPRARTENRAKRCSLSCWSHQEQSKFTRLCLQFQISNRPKESSQDQRVGSHEIMQVIKREYSREGWSRRPSCL